jgi:hypothetical protein
LKPGVELSVCLRPEDHQHREPRDDRSDHNRADTTGAVPNSNPRPTAEQADAKAAKGVASPVPVEPLDSGQER